MAKLASDAATRSFREKHRSLYSSELQCARYDAEICRRQGVAALLTAIEAIHPLQPHFHVVDAGCGTGKLARLLAPRVSRVSAFDRAADCLAVAREAAPPNVTYAEADLRRLPVADGCADVACAGWALSYLKAEHEEWYADGSYGGAWRDEVDAALGELDRALGDGGVAVIFETQGTATAAPRRGGSHLYAHLRDSGFAESCVRTDYSFSTPAAALETLTFFFGKGVASRAAELLRGAPPDEPCTVPECTGVWTRRKRPRVRVRIRAAGPHGVVCEIV